MSDSACLPENSAVTKNDASQSDISTSIVHLDKDELLDKLYKLNDDNLLLSEQLKQYRVVVETLEKKLTELNNVQNKKHQQITDTLLKILMQKKAQLKGGSHSENRNKRASKYSKCSKRSKRSKNHSKQRHSKRNSKH